MSNSFFDLVKRRRSIRRFTDQPIEQEKIDLLMKTVLMAPSSKNSKPWHFILVDDKEKLAKLSESRDHGSQLIAGAALAIVVVADANNGDVWIADASIASAYIQLQAENIGLGSCWVHVRNRNTKDGQSTEDYIRESLNIPAEFKVLNMIALGYKDEDKKTHDEEKLEYNKIHKNSF
jgi:nitroreductase